MHQGRKAGRQVVAANVQRLSGPNGTRYSYTHLMLCCWCCLAYHQNGRKLINIQGPLQKKKIGAGRSGNSSLLFCFPRLIIISIMNGIVIQLALSGGGGAHAPTGRPRGSGSTRQRTRAFMTRKLQRDACFLSSTEMNDWGHVTWMEKHYLFSFISH